MGRAYKIVNVSFNGQAENVIALVDTGADETVISQKLADKLNAELYGTFLARCASQTVLEGKYSSIRIKELESGKKAKIEVGVSDIPFDTDDINDEGIDIILGIDFLQETKLKVEV